MAFTKKEIKKLSYIHDRQLDEEIHGALNGGQPTYDVVGKILTGDPALDAIQGFSVIPPRVYNNGIKIESEPEVKQEEVEKVAEREHEEEVRYGDENFPHTAPTLADVPGFKRQFRDTFDDKTFNPEKQAEFDMNPYQEAELGLDPEYPWIESPYVGAVQTINGVPVVFDSTGEMFLDGRDILSEKEEKEFLAS
jgi:hypothetical protein